MFCSARIRMFGLHYIMGNYVSFLGESPTVFFRRMRGNPATVLTIYEYMLTSLSIFNYPNAMVYDF